MKKNRATIDKSFGPSRFNAVVRDLVSSSRSRLVASGDAFGCSKLVLDCGELHFAHEAAAAAVRPPFKLGYKTSLDYWKKIGSRTQGAG